MRAETPHSIYHPSLFLSCNTKAYSNQFLISPVIHIIQAHRIVNGTKTGADLGHVPHHPLKNLIAKVNRHKTVHRFQGAEIIVAIDIVMTVDRTAVQMGPVIADDIDTIQVSEIREIEIKIEMPNRILINRISIVRTQTIPAETT